MKKKVGYKFVKGDLRYTAKTLVTQNAVNFAVGFANALAGVGPGVMLQVIMMKMNMHPMVAERTGNLVAGVITTSSSICALYYQELPMDYGAVFGISAIIATTQGMTLRNWILKKSGDRYSVLVLLLFLMICCTFFSTTTLNLMDITTKMKAGEPVLEFRSYC